MYPVVLMTREAQQRYEQTRAKNSRWLLQPAITHQYMQIIQNKLSAVQLHEDE